MDVKEIQIKLKKVNRCFAHLEATKDVSVLDKDVLLGSIRELYETCIDQFSVDPSVQNRSVTNVESVQSTTVTTNDGPDVMNEEEKSKDESATSRSKPLMVFSNKKKPSGKKKGLELSPKPTQSTKKQDESMGDQIASTVKIEEVPVESNSADSKTELNISENKQQPSEAYEELFFFKEATDISQKLSEKPIKDLTRCLSLNDRFLFKKELFNNEDGKLEDVLSLLNDCIDFEQARAWIETHLIGSYEWTKNKQRKNKAKEFIKLARRRFL